VEYLNGLMYQHPSGKWLRGDRVAEFLTRASGVKFTVNYSPHTYLDGQPESQGHLFEVFTVGEPEEAQLIDDRRQESLESQAVANLRRLAAYYSDLAGRIEKELAPR